MAANPESAALKATRRSVTQRRRDEQRAAETPTVIGVGQPPRRLPSLGDPREPRQVLAAGPPLDGYVVAPEDVWESIIPRGCITPTARLRWARGQRVPCEVFAEHESARPAPTPEDPAE